MIPAWLPGIFAVIMLAVAALSAARLIISGRQIQPDADIDAAHILMGIAMAGTLASGLRTLPDGAWMAVFAVLAVWFSGRVLTESRHWPAGIAAGHHLPHLIHSAAMVYMFAAVTGAAGTATPGMGMAGGPVTSMGTLRVPTVGLIFVLLMVGWVVVDLDRISPSAARLSLAPSARRDRRVALAAAGPSLASSAPDVAMSTPAAGPSGPPDGGAAGSGTAWVVPVRGGGPGVLDPRFADGCRIAMGVTMALMLALMI